MRYGALVLVALCALSACTKSTPQPGNEPAQPSTAPSAAASTPVASLESVLAFKPELATERKVSELRADFNGDGNEDRLLVVKSASMPGALPAHVNVVRPWPLGQDETAGDLKHGASVNLVIAHGQGASQAPQITVLHDDNSISTLDAPAASELGVVKRPDLAALEQPSLAEAARGDVLIVPTEAGIDTYVYWDGSTYQSFTPAEEP